MDAIIDKENKDINCSPRLLKDELQKDRATKLYQQLAAARAAKDIGAQGEILDELFIFERTNPRLEILCDESRQEILAKKRAVLSELRLSDIYVLEKGPVEKYYPDTVTGSDKPTRAQSFCRLVTSPQEVREPLNFGRDISQRFVLLNAEGTFAIRTD